VYFCGWNTGGEEDLLVRLRWLGSALALLIALSGCTGGGAAASDIQDAMDQPLNLAPRSASAVPRLRDISDKENPFRGLYGQWDRWLYQRSKVKLSGAEQASGALNAYICLVTEDGWLVPQTERIRFDERAALSGEDERLTWSSIRVYGVMPERLSSAMLQAGEEVRADFCAPIPQWLAASPPRSAMLLPDGQVICEGLPSAEAAGSARRAVAAPYFLYSASGAQLATTGGVYLHLLDARWTEIISTFVHDPAWDGIVRGLESGRNDGYFAFFSNTGELLGAYDYTGAPVEASQLPLPRRDFLFRFLDGADIPGLYRAQQSR
jgi:hypothetical protein